MSPGSNTESYPAFALIGLRENPGKNLNQITCPDRDSNPGHLVSRPDAYETKVQYSIKKLSTMILAVKDLDEPMNLKKVSDVKQLLSKHFGPEWRNREDLGFSRDLLPRDVVVGQPGDVSDEEHDDPIDHDIAVILLFRCLWKRLKMKTKADMDEARKDAKRTGGGPAKHLQEKSQDILAEMFEGQFDPLADAMDEDFIPFQHTLMPTLRLSLLQFTESSMAETADGLEDEGGGRYKKMIPDQQFQE
ncbi:hypothetical protein ANN_20446 [Periplaneta americana]|uniref:Uncharacterized protein n=1 Tax=Periplaneta americana TaxID=6978 RepID=A0ABQ8SDF3_PERAM|nr:hypothetical protein ANN_20446 [Periplaneta americana]